jgi:hypothetical protein
MRPVGVLGASWAMVDNKEKECGDGMWRGIGEMGGSESTTSVVGVKNARFN